ncbi:glycosyltransferase family 2 protein, partial [Baudoinia panamericana UAMH 10762]
VIHLRTIAVPWIFLALEFFILLPNAIPYLLRTLAVRPAYRARQYLDGDNVPNVDLLVTACNEDVDVVMDTVRAACVLDYPRDKYRIFVCDDGMSETLKTAVDTHAAGNSQLHYTARVKGPIKDYKAGNLNHGLRYSGFLHPLMLRSLVSHNMSAAHLRDQSTRLSEDSSCATKSGQSTPSSHSTITNTHVPSHDWTVSWGEYVAGLDADMIPEPGWLRTLLPHIHDDPECAMVCPPQTFYDIPLNDPLLQTMSHFAGITEVVNDALGHADCLGSGYIMRRTALESIGGFPTESLSEDVCCSATLLGAGWRTAFVPEAVQYGSVPDSLLGHIKQRTRWWVGHIQTAMLFRLRLYGARAKHLSFRQRLAGLAFDLRQLVQVPLALSYIILPFALLSGSPMVFWVTGPQLKTLIRLVSVWTASHWIHNGIIGAIAGVGNNFTAYDIRVASYDSEMEQWLSPYYLVAFMRSFVLPKALGGAATSFKASGSISSNLHERDPENRAPLLRRLRVTLFSYHAAVHALFVLACITGVALNVARASSIAYIPNLWDTKILHTTVQRLTFLITRVGWPPLFWLQYVVSALTPITYAIWPPLQPDRESLLNRDEKTLVAYPKPSARMAQKTISGAWRYGRAVFAISYTLVLFVANEMVVL